MAAESADYCFADPPFGINYKPKTKRFGRIANDRLQGRALWEFFDTAFALIHRALKPDSAAHICGSWKTADVMLPALRKHFEVRACFAWVKNTPTTGYYTRAQWELIYLCTKGNLPRQWPAPPDVIQAKRVPVARMIHPTEKPVDLVARLMEPFTKVGQLVIDPFAGSAVVAVACHQLGRRFLGWEIDRAHWEAARGRLRMLARHDSVLQAPEGPEQ